MVKYQVRFSRQAQKDKQLIQGAGLERKARELIKIISEEPFRNPPPYEKLIGNFAGCYSRRINLQHRFVYEVLENTEQLTDENGVKYEGIVRVLRMWTHYERL
ncbi:MAG: Txe/YoeB family addiction module toxin [Lachnospiraceae bacterium]|nr:Txe/YoeB family addiction module toxin [Lachnospiraceae bacterium]